MKIRIGFVSNSSSSSFCVWGIDLDFEILNKALDMGFDPDSDYAYDYEKIMKMERKLSDLLKDTEITFGIGEECYGVCGRPYSSLKDDETGAEFKEKAEKILKKIFGEQTKCHFINTEVHT